jgi:hypothetical protein
MPAVHPADAKMAALREAEAATKPTRAEIEQARIHYDSLTDEQRAEYIRQASAGKSTVRLVHDPATGEMRGVELPSFKSDSRQPLPGVEGILATARSIGGIKRGSYAELQPNDVVRVNGMEMSVATATRMKYLTVNRIGEYAEPAAPTAEQVAAEAEAKAAAEAEQNAGIVRDHLAPDFHAAVEELGVLTDGKANTTIGAIIAQTVAADGDVTKAAEQLASRIGGEIDYSRTVIQNAIASGTKTAAEYIGRNFPGVDGEAVIELASRTGSKSERASRINRIVLGDRSVFSELVADYRKQQRREEYSFPRRNG